MDLEFLNAVGIEGILSCYLGRGYFLLYVLKSRKKFIWVEKEVIDGWKEVEIKDRVLVSF